ncbi:MAG: ABC transporter permease [Lachnospiraceae bacterium]
MNKRRIAMAALLILLDLAICIFTHPSKLLLVLFNIAGGILVAKADRVLHTPMELWKSRTLIWNLSKNDFKTRFAGSYFGILWAFVQPIVTILMYWFVFTQTPFRPAKSVDGIPFVLNLIGGLVPWFVFSEALTSGTNALLEYSYLVKKVVFKIDILPVVKVISASFIHFFFLLVSFVICACMGYGPSLYLLQLPYYLICMWAFVIALVYATSAIVLFFRDLTQIINIFMQVFMWVTPIMWDDSLMPESIRWIFHLNPMYYVTNGYKDSLLHHVGFWEHMDLTLYFWTVTGLLFLIGTTIFQRLRPHFADVL